MPCTYGDNYPSPLYRRVSQFSESYIRSVASKATSDLETTINTQTQRCADFEEQLSLFLSATESRVNKEGQQRKAEVVRHSVTAKELWRKVPVYSRGLTESSSRCRLIYVFHNYLCMYRYRQWWMRRAHLTSLL